MLEIQYFQGINNVETKELNSWIRNYIINNMTDLNEREVTFAAYNADEKEYKIVFSKEIIKNVKYYFIAMYENEKCYMKNYITEDDNFSSFENNFMKLLIILKKLAKGEDITLFNTQKINLDNTKENAMNTLMSSKKDNDNKKYKLCTDCIHVDIGSSRKPALKCNKRKCRLSDKTEANWCKFYKE